MLEYLMGHCFGVSGKKAVRGGDKWDRLNKTVLSALVLDIQ